MKNGSLDLGYTVHRERLIAVSTRRSKMELTRVMCTLEQYSLSLSVYTVLYVCLDNETSRSLQYGRYL